MPQVARVTLKVRTPRDAYDFGAEVHFSQNPKEQRIDPEFYEKYAGRVPEGAHHEFLLFQSPAWNRVDPEVAMHVYRRKDSGESFVCYIHPIETLEHAKEFFQWWCLGVIYSIEHKEDSAAMIERHPDDFLKVMERDYGTVIAEESWDTGG